MPKLTFRDGPLDGANLTDDDAPLFWPPNEMAVAYEDRNQAMSFVQPNSYMRVQPATSYPATGEYDYVFHPDDEETR